MTTAFAAVSTTPLPHHVAAAEVYIRRCHADRDVTQGKVAELAYALASRPEWQTAIDHALAGERARADRAESLARRLATTARRLERENSRLRGRIVGAIAVLRNAHDARKPGMAAVAVSNALLALECSADEEDLRREAMLSGRHPAGRALNRTTD